MFYKYYDIVHVDYLKMMLLFLSICISHIVEVDSTERRITKFAIYNAPSPGFNAFTCSRLTDKSGIFIGCKMNTTSKEYSRLSLNYCTHQNNRPGFVYMLKYSLFITPLMDESSASFTTSIPMCMKQGSRIEFSFIPKSGWLQLFFFLKNREDDNVLRVRVRDTIEIVTLQSILNGTVVNSVVSFNYPFLTDQSNNMLIELGEDSFMLYHNGILYYNYSYQLDNNIPTVFRFQFNQVVGDLLYVEFTK